MKKQSGLIHIYCGDGKGKTTCAMGLCARASGYGYKALIYQFMKDNTTNERNTLMLSPNIAWIDGLSIEKFSFQMTSSEKEFRKTFYNQQFKNIVLMVKQEQFSVLLLDEILYTIAVGLFDEELLIEFLSKKPSDLEVILTGQSPSEKLIEIADYVSEIKKIKHPFERGIIARKGFEN